MTISAGEMNCTSLVKVRSQASTIVLACTKRKRIIAPTAFFSLALFSNFLVLCDFRERLLGAASLASQFFFYVIVNSSPIAPHSSSPLAVWIAEQI